MFPVRPLMRFWSGFDDFDGIGLAVCDVLGWDAGAEVAVIDRRVVRAASVWCVLGSTPLAGAAADP